MARLPYKWQVVAMLWWIAFFNYADRQAIFSVFPLLEREMHLTPIELGMLGSSFAWVYGLSAPLAGNIVDRIRRKTAILGGLQAWSVICMATALSRNFGHLLFFRAAEGLGETFYFPASMSLVSDYHGKETRSRALGMHQTSVYMGTIAGGFFAGLIAQHYGWRWSFVVFGGLGVLLGLGLRKYLIEPKRESSTGDAPAKLSMREFTLEVWRTPSALLLMAAFMCSNFVAVVLLTWMPKFLYDKFHLSLAMAGFTATVFVQLASMVGSPLGGWLADTLRKRRPGGRMLVQATALFCGAPFVILCGQTQSEAWLVVALIAWGLFKGLYDANIFASVFDVIRPEARGTVAGFMNMVGWLGGGGTAPIVIGYIAQRTNLSLAISMAAGVYVIGAILLLIAALVFAPKDAVPSRNLSRDSDGAVLPASPLHGCRGSERRTNCDNMNALSPLEVTVNVSKFSAVVLRLAVAATLTTAVAFCASSATMTMGKAELKSAGELAFGPDGILFVGDSVGAAIVAIDTGDRTQARSAAKIEIKGINEKIAALLGATPDQILVKDVVVNPLSKKVYISVSRGRGPDAVPVILRADAAGKITEVSLDNVKHSMVSLPDAPQSKEGGRSNPRLETITHMAFVNGNIIVAGLSNEEFSSSLRSIPFPFQQAGRGASIEIFHGSHGRFETNSPVRTFVAYNLKNQPHILAAYTCTPLVSIPVSELRAGAKVKGTTIAELGNRNRPLDMIVYNKGGRDYILMANSSRGIMKMPAEGIDGFQPVLAHTEKAGVAYETIAELKGVQQLDKLDDANALMLIDTAGSLDLRTIALP